MAATKTRPAKSLGHAEHTKSAAQKGLPGEFRRPIKITMLGAGSGFTPRLVNDVLQTPGNRGGTIALVDIDPARLGTMHQLIEKLIVKLGKTDWTVQASRDRTEVLAGSDYLINCIEVSGLACVRFDNDIPAKFGLDQCIGDTIGPGGLFKALRTVPTFIEVLRDAERLCPRALVLNYTNPMNMMCLAAARAVPSMSVVGLCHSVQGTSNLLSRRAGVPYDEMDWECAGINHLAWFTKLEHGGKDLYPILMKKAKVDLEGKAADREDADLVRKDMMVHFGAFITESSGHLSEYLPYYRKQKDIMARYCRLKYDGESSFYANEWPGWRKKADADRMAMVNGKQEMNWDRSWEYASWIIEAREKDSPVRIHGNVMNSVDGVGKLISNLPGNGCVEVACMIDRNGVNPTRYGALPPQMAALCDSNMRMFELGATAAVERSKEAAIYSLMLDPLTSAVCSPAQIKEMTLEMFAAEKKFLPGYK